MDAITTIAETECRDGFRPGRREQEWRDWLAASAQRDTYLARIGALPPGSGFFGLWGQHAEVIAELRET
jgi:hypothetical protein